MSKHRVSARLVPVLRGDPGRVRDAEPGAGPRSGARDERRPRLALARGRARTAGDGAVPLRAGEEPAARDGPGSGLRLSRRAGHARRPRQAYRGPGRAATRTTGRLDDPGPAGIAARPGRRGDQGPRHAPRPCGRRPVAVVLPRPVAGADRPARGGRRRGVRAGPRRASPRGTTCSTSSRRWAGSISAGRSSTRRWRSGAGWSSSSPATSRSRSRSPRRWPRRGRPSRPSRGTSSWPGPSATRSARRNWP